MTDTDAINAIPTQTAPAADDADRLVSVADLVRLGWFHNTVAIYRAITHGNFPRGFLIGGNSRRFRLSECRTWLASREQLATGPARTPKPRRAAVAEAAQRGQYSDEKKDLQQFDTPPMLATRMVDLADLRPGYQVLEPSAGIGMLVDVIAFRGADVTAIEISQERCRKLMGLPKRDGRISIYCADFTTWANLPVYPKGRTGFDAVIMNPPFAKAQDAVHIMTAWRLVRPGGRLVALASPTVRFNTQHIYQSFRKWLKRIEAETEDLPGGTFAESGTTVGAVLISATKPGREELVLGA